MSLAPYLQHRGILAANCEVADREALLLAEAHSQEYALAKSEYQLAHARYSTRMPRAAPRDASELATADTIREDIRYYTSCPEPNTNPYYNEDGAVSTRAINRELKERARIRQQDDVERARRAKESALLTGGKKAKGEPVLRMLARLEEQEHEDILAFEAQQFRSLARAYYDTFYGEFDRVLSLERQSRRTMEDFHLDASMNELSHLRDHIHRSEELLMMRAMGMYSSQLTRNSRAQAQLAVVETARQAEDAKALDSMYAVALWQRVMAIRAETEAEEEVAMRTVGLAHVMEADFIDRGLGRQNMASGGVFEFSSPASVPEFLGESVRYVCAAERLFCELEEETRRMVVIDDALKGCEELYSAMHQITEHNERGDAEAEAIPAIMQA